MASASHEVEAIVEELQQQQEELVEARQAVEEERQRYQEFFDLVPDPGGGVAGASPR